MQKLVQGVGLKSITEVQSMIKNSQQGRGASASLHYKITTVRNRHLYANMQRIDSMTEYLLK
jgi:hypothetical protein